MLQGDAAQGGDEVVLDVSLIGHEGGCSNGGTDGREPLALKEVIQEKSGSFDMGAARNGADRFGQPQLRFSLGEKSRVEFLPTGKTLF